MCLPLDAPSCHESHHPHRDPDSKAAVEKPHQGPSWTQAPPRTSHLVWLTHLRGWVVESSSRGAAVCGEDGGLRSSIPPPHRANLPGRTHTPISSPRNVAQLSCEHLLSTIGEPPRSPLAFCGCRFPREKHLRFIHGCFTKMERVQARWAHLGGAAGGVCLLTANCGANPTSSNLQIRPAEDSSMHTAAASTYQILLAALLPSQL